MFVEVGRIFGSDHLFREAELAEGHQSGADEG